LSKRQPWADISKRLRRTAFKTHHLEFCCHAAFGLTVKQPS
jgi:hypothetical protein